MCDLFGSGDSGQGAASDTEQTIEGQQHAYQTAVTQGQQAIDSAFSQFTPDYYTNYENAYIGSQEPQLDYSYGRAKDKLAAQLAGTDQLDGAVGADQLGQLAQEYNTDQTNIGNSAADAANSLKSTVANTKANLYSLDTGAADPMQLGATATADASALVAPQSFPTAANYFSDVLGPLGSAAKANASSANPASIGQIASGIWQGSGLGTGNGSAGFSS